VALAPRPPLKPRWRGRIHAAAAPAVLAAGIVLTARAPTARAAVAAGIFAATAVLLFTVSAACHPGTWSLRMRVLLRRLDHASILFLIAGTCTPRAVLALHGSTRLAILCVVWGGATLGAVFGVAWPYMPRWAYVPVYLTLGWAAAFVLPQLLRGAGLAALVLIAAGGVRYTLGGVAYGLRRPDPWPRRFGFHEVFHACTVAAFACQYIAVSLLVYRGAGPRQLSTFVPAGAPRDVAVTVSGGTLTTKAERHDGKEGKDHSEFRYGAFGRRTALSAADEEHVQATCDPGILEPVVDLQQELPGRRGPVRLLPPAKLT
jgi:hemolysin III